MISYVPQGRGRVTTRKPVPDCIDPSGHHWRTGKPSVAGNQAHYKQNCTVCHVGRTAVIDLR